MTDDLYELNKKFIEDQQTRDTCGMKGCHAPKNKEISTEAGIPIAVCVYHELVGLPKDLREERAQKFYNRSFEEIKEDWEEYNQAIEGENLE